MNNSLLRNVARVLTTAVVSGAAVFTLAAPASAAPADCAYNPNGCGGYGSYVDGLALDQRDWEADLANAINAYRTQNGLSALTYSRTLARPAMWASLDSHNRGFSPANHIDTRGMGIPSESSSAPAIPGMSVRSTIGAMAETSRSGSPRCRGGSSHLAITSGSWIASPRLLL